MFKLGAVLVAAALATVLAAVPRDARAADDEEEPASCLSCHAVGATKGDVPEGRRFANRSGPAGDQ